MVRGWRLLEAIRLSERVNPYNERVHTQQGRGGAVRTSPVLICPINLTVLFKGIQKDTSRDIVTKVPVGGAPRYVPQRLTSCLLLRASRPAKLQPSFVSLATRLLSFDWPSARSCVSALGMLAWTICWARYGSSFAPLPRAQGACGAFGQMIARPCLQYRGVAAE